MNEIDDIKAELEVERWRQIQEEGWTPEHDDEHQHGELARAAHAYVRWGAGSSVPHGTPPADWPWEASWWKPKDRRRDLVRAGALYIAERDRMQRRIDEVADAIAALDRQESKS